MAVSLISSLVLTVTKCSHSLHCTGFRGLELELRESDGGYDVLT